MKILILFFALTTTLSFQAQSIEGDWNTGNENTIVKIQGNDSVYQGKVLSSDKIKHGTLMLRNLKQNKDVYEGEVFVFKKNKWYDAELKPEKETLHVTVKVSFVQKTVKWKKL